MEHDVSRGAAPQPRSGVGFVGMGEAEGGTRP